MAEEKALNAGPAGIGLARDRDHGRLAIARQAAAAVATGDRTARLRSLRVPAWCCTARRT
jgi:hypothetical protein